jgi:acetyl esterase
MNKLEAWIFRLVYRMLSYRGWYGSPLPEKGVKVSMMDIPLEDTNNVIVKGVVFSPPEPSERKPLVVSFHGGGMCLGGGDTTHYNFNLKLAAELNCAVVAVNYRLAPEHPFPIPLDDCTNATNWISQNTDKFPANDGFIAIVGDSAGGHAVIVTAMETTAKNLKAAIPIYPNTESLKDKFKSWTTYATGYESTADLVQKLYTGFLSNTSPAEFDEANTSDPKVLERAFPLRYSTESLKKKMPPTFIITAEHDVLRDEGVAFAEKLKEAGNKNLVHQHVSTQEHSFMCTMGENADMVKCLGDIKVWLEGL